MGSGADNPPVLDDEDEVGVDDGSDPLGHYDLGRPRGLLGQGLAQVSVCSRIKGGERVVEQVYRGILAHGPRDREPLLLPPGEVPSVLGDVAVHAFGHSLDELLQLCDAYRAPSLLFRLLASAVAYVVPHGAREDQRRLRDVAYHGAELLLGVVPDIPAAHLHLPLRRIVEACDEADHRRLAAGSGAYDGEGGAPLGLEGDVMEDLGAGSGVGERHVIEPHRSGIDGVRGIAGAVADRRFVVDDLLYPSGRHQDVGHHPEDARSHHDRREHHCRIGCEDDHVREEEHLMVRAACGAVYDACAGPVDGHGEEAHHR